MRFPRQTRIFRGQFDAAPFAAVFFLILIFVSLNTLLVTPPGVSLRLPVTIDLPGTDQPTVVVAIDASGHLYFEQQLINEIDLQSRLEQTVRRIQEPVTLVIQADRSVAYERLIQISLLAEAAGIKTALLATRPAGLPAPVSIAP